MRRVVPLATSVLVLPHKRGFLCDFSPPLLQKGHSGQAPDLVSILISSGEFD